MPGKLVNDFDVRVSRQRSLEVDQSTVGIDHLRLGGLFLASGTRRQQPADRDRHAEANAGTAPLLRVLPGTASSARMDLSRLGLPNLLSGFQCFHSPVGIGHPGRVLDLTDHPVRSLLAVSEVRDSNHIVGNKQVL